MKLYRTMHVAGGSGAARSCIREDYRRISVEMRAPQLYLWVCSLWDRICQRVRT